ncbi:tRNA (5-methylaminomethyl-2-thiouridine)(34)-methyltransferase MnmD [Chryseolinea lacunae]|uniref:tRNA (5-methylaminomethyl-2-thiouridine)(34)-methyltransferase MnmD n=1 Tax=Chryseolinea lacunae TaxID=2801331 RepID=A0ABS1KQG9_9BACT|nr:tRNA (5-methylaminomethyl-2-thiouridine)(34)-methyltransferase MnmD [Chryseolinea lacunae]MBL0741548.1 tRNA (5-methylaminomethyl-2-thiouridine)(34)-methyltransferase MnmD [Chryseolinea lacunae]
MPLKLITTADGSHSLLNEELNETYHSVHGALQESVHVFIAHGLVHRLSTPHETPLAIFEVGFGTGLNALLTLDFAEQHSQAISYTSIEAFPVTADVWQTLNYAATPEQKVRFEMLHHAPWETAQNLTPHFALTKLQTTLQNVSLPPASFDVIYFDAFAPNKQPELWTFDMLQKAARLLKPDGVFVTYCAKGQLKRDLKALNLTTETLPGPPGKKEMVRATKPVQV